jgi:hypothetical protein
MLLPKDDLNPPNLVWKKLILGDEDVASPKIAFVKPHSPGEIKQLIIMEDDPIQAYDRRMRRFNFAVIVAALIALAVLIINSCPFLQ